MIRDRIVFDVNKQTLRKKLIDEGEALEKAIQVSQNFGNISLLCLFY